MLPLFDAKRNTAISFALRTTGNMPYAALEGIPQLNAMDYARYALSLLEGIPFINSLHLGQLFQLFQSTA